MTNPLPPSDAVTAQPVRTEPKAVVALVLAVAAYTPIVPFLGAVVALLLAGRARRDILASGGTLSGLGVVQAAKVLAWVHLAFVALVLLLVVLALLGVFTLSLFGVRVG